MNSMAVSSMTQSLSSLDLGTETPKFVNLESRYKCVNCKQWLRHPMQTSCGHRICRSCFNKWFSDESEHGQGVPCPANEDGCELITRDKVYPDHSAAREIRQQRVFCTYKKYGCNETPALGKLKEHVSQCPFVKKCPHCKERIMPDELDNHIKDKCPDAPIKCVYCEMSDIPRHELVNHHKVCLLKPQRCKYHTMGCRIELPTKELLLHENDAQNHLEMFAEHVSTLELKNTQLQAQFQSSLMELDSAKSQLSTYFKENAELKRHVGELQNAVSRSEERHSQIIATQNEKIAQLETQIRALDNKTQEIGRIKSKCTQLEQRISESGVAQAQEVSLPEDVRKKFIAHDRTIGLHDVRLSELDLRLQCTETANYEGVLIWKIGEYRERKRQAVEGRILSLYSQPFYTSRYGYKMCARIYLNGDGVGRGTHMSLFFVVMQGDYDEILTWPFRQKVTLTLIDQLNNRRHLSDTFRPDPTSSSFQKPSSPMNVASGCPLFVPHDVLEGSEGLYLRNNTIFIKLVVDTTDLLNP